MTFLEVLDEMRNGKIVVNSRTGTQYKLNDKGKVVWRCPWMCSSENIDNLTDMDWRLMKGGEDE